MTSSRLTLWNLAVALILMGMATGLTAQNSYSKAKPAAKKQSPTAEAPVSKGEVQETFRRMRQIASQAILKKPMRIQVGEVSATSASRADVIAQMDTMFEWLKPSFKFSPKALPYRKDFLTIPAGSKTRSSLEKLLAFGCVDKFGPLATAKKETMTIAEFGDAVGYFMARICDLTHTPSAKFSPALMNQG